MPTEATLLTMGPRGAADCRQGSKEWRKQAGKAAAKDIAKLNGEIAEGYLENVDYGRAASS